MRGMKKFTRHPFLASASVFGATAFVATLLFSHFNGWGDLLRSDNPYIYGFALASFNAFAGLIYFILRDVELRWLKPIPGLLVYYFLIVVFFLYAEYIGGEVAGFGYLFIKFIVLAFPVLFLHILFASNHKLLYVGISGGVIYLLAFAFVVLAYYT